MGKGVTEKKNERDARRMEEEQAETMGETFELREKERHSWHPDAAS